MPPSGGKNPVPVPRGPGSSSYGLPDLGQITELSTSVNEVLDSMLMVVPTALPFLLCLMRGL